jgi:RimJ/RimL family protein N-acetyltransferase
MAPSYWPLFDLRVRTPRLELRVPTDEILSRVMPVIDGGIHNPDTMPFSVAWTDVPVPRRHHESMQHWWAQRANWKVDAWNLTGVVLVDGEPVGMQDMQAKDFASLRTVGTGSWLGREYQGRGLGKEMRAAVLHLAFEGLGAVAAHSGAFHDNEASLATSRSLGYEPNGESMILRRGRPDRMLHLRLTREAWLSRRRDDIEIEGLDGCLDMFGLGDSGDAAGESV